MQPVRLLNCNIDDFTFQKNMKPEQTVKLETSIKYSVHFFSDQKVLEGDSLITVQDSGHEGLFRLKFHQLSHFSIDEIVTGNEDKRSLHISTSRILQPLWNLSVKQFCVLAGIPAIELPPYVISEENIHMS